MLEKAGPSDSSLSIPQRIRAWKSSISFDAFEGFHFPLVLLFGFLLRVASIAVAPFVYDEQEVFNRALALAEGRAFTFFGHELGMWDVRVWGGFLVYVTAIPLFFVKTHLAASVFYAFLNTLVIFFLYHLVARVFSRRHAFYASLLYLASPWAISSSAGLYNPNLSALFGFATFTGLLLALRWRSETLLWLAPGFVFASISCEIVNVALLGPFLGAVLLFRPRWRWRPMMIGSAFLLVLPSALYEWHTDFRNLSRFFEIVRTGDGAWPNYPVENLKVFQWILAVPTGEIGYLIGRTPAEFKRFFDLPWGLLFAPAIIASVVLVFYSHAMSLGQTRPGMARATEFRLIYACLLGFVGFALLIGLIGRTFEARHIYALFPVLFILMSEGLCRLEDRFGRRVTMLFWIMMAVEVVMTLRLITTKLPS